MHIVEPKAFVIADTAIENFGLRNFLDEIGAGDWLIPEASADGELLVEIAGRTCYKSFGTELNKNLTQVRKDHHEYVGNIIKTKHGSVFEHATTTMGLVNVSRILTHELVRHRAGCAYSQESMRFVRLEDVGMYYPEALGEDYLTAHEYEPDVAAEVKDIFCDAAIYAENAYTKMVNLLGLDNPKLNFAIKKVITSALRRIAPSGHSTNIVITANHRAWRHLIELRTASGAEEEIQRVFHDIACQFAQRYPAFYQDMMFDEGDWQLPVSFKNGKI